MSVKMVEAGELKKGSYVIIDGVACRVVSVEKSKPGKHGSAKVRVVAIGIFDNSKRGFVVPTDAKVEVPIIEKRTAIVTAKLPDSVQIMDLETNEIFEVPYPEDEEVKEKLESGIQVEYWTVMDQRRIVRIRGGI